MSSSAIGLTSYERIRFGACSTLDVNGNPTPDDPVAADDTLLYATSYPDPVDNGTGQITTFHGGDMVFRAVGGAWEWFGGSFQASNAWGNYRRSADKTQYCYSVGHATTPGSGNFSWSLPATFESSDYVWDYSYQDKPGYTANEISSSSTFASVRINCRDGGGANVTIAISINLSATGKWAA